MKNKRPPVKKEAKEAVYVGIPLDDVLKTEMLDCSKDLIHFLQAAHPLDHLFRAQKGQFPLASTQNGCHIIRVTRRGSR